MPNLAAAAAYEQLIELLESPMLSFQPVESIAQLRELFAIDADAYGDCSLEFETFRDWWERYGWGSRVLLADDQRIIASVGIYPLQPQQADDFERGAIPESALRPVQWIDDRFDPVSNWYVSGIVVAEDLRGWASPLGKLLRFGIASWLDSRHIAYPASVLSLGQSDLGKRCLEMLGFEKLQDAAQMPDRCDLYKLVLSDRSRTHAQFTRLFRL